LHNIIHDTQIMLPHYLENLKCSNVLHFIVSLKMRRFLTDCNFVVCPLILTIFWCKNRDTVR